MNFFAPFIARDEGTLHIPMPLLVFINVLALAIALFHIANAHFLLVDESQRNMLHFAGFALLAVFYYPLSRNNPRATLWLDIALGVAAVAAVLYFMLIRDDVYLRQQAQLAMFTPTAWLFAVFLLIAVLELTRRTTGWIIPILILLALSYISWLGSEITGIFQFSGLSADTTGFRSIYGDNALFGTIATISSTYVFLFIIFGAFLIRSGAGDFVVDLACGVAGRFVGGPGWVAVIASGLTGTISGSAVANTASTGVITIPLMKEAGFPPRFAAGIEAAASTGGQIMPPIMGAGAFVMASYTLIPYEHIIAVSFLPAALYFLSVAMFVRIEAKKHALPPMRDANSKPFTQALKEQGASFIAPITLLIILLIQGYTPTYAALAGIGAIVVSSWFTKTKMGLAACIEALISASKGMIMMGVLLCAVGLIVNAITTTGIGTTFSLMIAQWADGNLMIAIVLIALASLVLGMGLPVTAAYIVLATLSAPALLGMMLDAQLVQILADGTLPQSVHPMLMLADPALIDKVAAPMPLAEAQSLLKSLPSEVLHLVRQEGVDAGSAQAMLLSAHMIIFWLSQDSNVTPPVCLAAFTAAVIAKTPPMATGFTSWKLAKGLYIMPVLFAYTPFLHGDFTTAFIIFAFACAGTYAWAAAFQGCMERPIGILWRLLAAIAGTALLWPDNLVRLGGLGLLIILFAAHLRFCPPAIARPAEI